MGIQTGRQRPFPALAIVSVLGVLCLFPGQRWIANLLPGIAGLARIDPSLTILDIPVQIPVRVDLILVSGLFILSYLVVILLYPSRSGMFSWREALQRVGAVVAGVFALLLCLASGALISYLSRDYLPRSVRNGIDSLGINADIHLPYAGYEDIHLRGNIILLIFFIIGIAICIQQIKRAPRTRKVVRLTGEQRMTPYERMLRDKRQLEKQKAAEARMTTHAPSKTTDSQSTTTQAPAKTILSPSTTTQARSKQDTSRKTGGAEAGSTRLDGKDLPALCRHHPVLTIQPEAVNYMPMGM